jgi:hypothetical protein
MSALEVGVTVVLIGAFLGGFFSSDGIERPTRAEC